MASKKYRITFQGSLDLKTAKTELKDFLKERSIEIDVKLKNLSSAKKQLENLLDLGEMKQDLADYKKKYEELLDLRQKESRGKGANKDSDTLGISTSLENWAKKNKLLLETNEDIRQQYEDLKSAIASYGSDGSKSIAALRAEFSTLSTDASLVSKEYQEQAKQFEKVSKEYDNIQKKAKATSDTYNEMSYNLEKVYKNNKDLIDSNDDLKEEYKELTKSMEAFQEGSVSKGELSLQMKKFKDNVKDADKETKSLSKSWKSLQDHILGAMVSAQIINTLINVLKDAVEQVKELDRALVEIQKVSSLDGAGLEKFKDQAFEIGATVGRTGKEMIDAAAEFKRSGYTLQESLDLGKQANIMLNVADGMDNINDSAAVLISTMKAYNIETEKAYTINDIFNEVSNTSAISFDDLADGVRRTAGVYAQSGTELEELTGLLTATNEIMQNIEKSSSGLNTISQRLRGIKEAGDETTPSVAKLQEAFKAYANVNILDPVTGQLRGTYDILHDTAMAWDGLTENQRQYLGELAAGKRQVNVFNALMTNFDKAISATSSAYNSLNSAQEENTRFMDSVQGRLNNFHSAWQQLATDTIDSEFVKDVIDLGTALLHLTNNIGGVGVAMGLLTAVSMVKFKDYFAKILPKALNGFIDKMIKSEATAKFLKGTLEATSISASLLKAALGALVVTAIISGFIALYNALKENADVMGKLNDKIDESKTKISEINSEINALRSSGELTEEERQRLAALEKELALREKMLAMQEREKAGYVFTYGNAADATMREDGTIELAVVYKPDENNEYVIQDIIADLEQIPQKLEEANANKLKAIDEGDIEAVDKYTREIVELEDKLLQSTTVGQEGFNAYAKAVQNGFVATDSIREQYEKLGDLLPVIVDDILQVGEALDENEMKVTSLQDRFSTLQTELTTMKSNITGLVKVWEEYNSAGEISVKTLLEIISNYPALLQYLELQNGQYVLNKKAVTELFETEKDRVVKKLEEDKEELKSRIKLNDAMILSLKIAQEGINNLGKSGTSAISILSSVTQTFLMSIDKSTSGVLSFANEMLKKVSGGIKDNTFISQLESENKDLMGQIAALDEQITYVKNLTLPDFTSKVEKAGSATKKAKKETKELTEEQKKLKEELENAEKALDTYADKMGAYFDQITDALDDEIADLDKANEKLEQMGDMFNAFGDYIVQGLEDEIDAIDKAAEAEKDRLQEKLDAMEEEEKLNDRNKKLEEARLNIAQAQEALERAKRQKVHIYREGKGFVYETDFSSVSDAQDQLDEAQGKYDDLVGEYEKEDIKDSIKDQMEQVDKDAQNKKDKIQAQIDSLKDLMGAWGNSTAQILDNILSQQEAQEWLDEFQSASASKRKEMLQELDEAYYDMVQSELDKNNERIEDLENLKNEFQNDYDEIKASMNEYQMSEAELNEFLKMSIEDRKAWLKDLTSTWKSEISSMIAEINRLKAAMGSLEGASAGAIGGGGSSSSSSSSGKWSGLHGDSQLSKGDTESVNKFNPVDNPELADKAGEIWDAIHTGNKSDAVQNAIDKAQGKKKKSYAQGGTRIVDYTGWEKGMANTWVDGTPLKPEVVLNNTDAKKLYDMVHNAPVPYSGNEDERALIINVANLELPNVRNAETFVEDLKNYSVNHAVQLSKCRR